MAEKTLTMITKTSNLRSEAVGWTHEDSNLYVNGRSVGFTPGPRSPACYPNALAAQANGWKLLAPPVYNKGEEGWDWWFTKESEE